MEENNRIYISDFEYARLCRIEGKMEALTDYIKSTNYVDEKVIMAIIGMDYFK